MRHFLLRYKNQQQMNAVQKLQLHHSVVLASYHKATQRFSSWTLAHTSVDYSVISREYCTTAVSASCFVAIYWEQLLRACRNSFGIRKTRWKVFETSPAFHFITWMGSFTSAPKILNEDSQDSDVRVPTRQTREEVLARCRKELAERRPPLVRRAFRHAHALQHAAAPAHENGDHASGPFHMRVLQWNVLSQTLGKSNDNFVCCPDEALEWSSRRYQIMQEIVQYSPDVICLQEVDHFNFLQTFLGSLGYSGTFFPKPDSPCLYIQGNNGPDGCAIFFNDSKFELLRTESRILEVWRVQSNQVALLCILKVQETGQEVCVATTHLKARSGALLSTLRNEQGKDLLEFVNGHAEGRPVILSGDFNAEPTEPVYMTLLSNQKLCLASAYTALVKDNISKTNQEHVNVHTSIKCEPPYTTWKIREEGEICHTIDYIFYSREAFTVESLLEFPTGEEIGKNRVPSMCYPSDHFSLCCDFKFMNKNHTRS